MNSNDIAKKYMIYPHKLNSFIKQSDLKYSRRLFNSYEVYEEPEVVYEKYIEYMKKVEAEEKAKNQKIKIKREDWMFIFDTADPDFEKKFNSLLEKYIKNSKIEISEMKDMKERKILQSKMNSFLWYLGYENWLTILPVEPKIALTEKAKKRQLIYRGRLFSNFWDEFGMTDDFPSLFNDIDTRELAHAGVLCYRKLYEIQKERARHRGIRGMIFKLINLFNNDTEEKPVEEAEVVYKPELASDKQEEIDNKAAEEGPPAGEVYPIRQLTYDKKKNLMKGVVTIDNTQHTAIVYGIKKAEYEEILKKDQAEVKVIRTEGKKLIAELI